MVKPIDITKTVIVPKPRQKTEKLKSFFIGHVDHIIEDEIKGMRHNAVNIDFLKEQVKKLNEDVEKLIRNGSGAH